jgi:hypothetical protein
LFYVVQFPRAKEVSLLGFWEYNVAVGGVRIYYRDELQGLTGTNQVSALLAFAESSAELSLIRANEERAHVAISSRPWYQGVVRRGIGENVAVSCVGIITQEPHVVPIIPIPSGLIITTHRCIVLVFFRCTTVVLSVIVI